MSRYSVSVTAPDHGDLVPVIVLKADGTYSEHKTSYGMIPKHDADPDNCEYLKNGKCYHCCVTCNEDLHGNCHFCGDYLDHHGRVSDYGYFGPGYTMLHIKRDNPCYINHDKELNSEQANNSMVE